MATFPARELALHFARLLDGKGQDLVVLQQPTGAHSFDYVVLSTASSERLAYHLVEEAYHFCKRHAVPRHPIEGETGWMLLDCYDVIVHALSPEAREKYQLEDLWRLARKVDWAKELKDLADPDKPVVVEKPKKASRAKKKTADTANEEVATKPAAKKRKAAPRVARGDRDTTELPAVEPAGLTQRRTAKRPAAAKRKAPTKRTRAF